MTTIKRKKTHEFDSRLIKQHLADLTVEDLMQTIPAPKPEDAKRRQEGFRQQQLDRVRELLKPKEKAVKQPGPTVDDLAAQQIIEQQLPWLGPVRKMPSLEWKHGPSEALDVNFSTTPEALAQLRHALGPTNKSFDLCILGGKNGQLVKLSDDTKGQFEGDAAKVIGDADAKGCDQIWIVLRHTAFTKDMGRAYELLRAQGDKGMTIGLLIANPTEDNSSVDLEAVTLCRNMPKDASPLGLAIYMAETTHDEVERRLQMRMYELQDNALMSRKKTGDKIEIQEAVEYVNKLVDGIFRSSAELVGKKFQIPDLTAQFRDTLSNEEDNVKTELALALSEGTYEEYERAQRGFLYSIGTVFNAAATRVVIHSPLWADVNANGTTSQRWSLEIEDRESMSRMQDDAFDAHLREFARPFGNRMTMLAKVGIRLVPSGTFGVLNNAPEEVKREGEKLMPFAAMIGIECDAHLWKALAESFDERAVLFEEEIARLKKGDEVPGWLPRLVAYKTMIELMGESKKKPDELEKVGLKTVLDGANQRYKKLAEHAGELFGDEYSKVELLYDTFATELKGTRPDAGDLALLREFYPKK